MAPAGAGAAEGSGGQGSWAQGWQSRACRGEGRCAHGEGDSSSERPFEKGPQGKDSGVKVTSWEARSEGGGGGEGDRGKLQASPADARHPPSLEQGTATKRPTRSS